MSLLLLLLSLHEITFFLIWANDRYVGKDYLGDMDHLEEGLVG